MPKSRCLTIACLLIASAILGASAVAARSLLVPPPEERRGVVYVPRYATDNVTKVTIRIDGSQPIDKGKGAMFDAKLTFEIDGEPKVISNGETKRPHTRVTLKLPAKPKDSPFNGDPEAGELAFTTTNGVVIAIPVALCAWNEDNN